ncbi:MAG: DNA repair protein RadC [candidate division NC10 bacterium]|nr:DNA repair protein RadC [candidate division NC10 bacterium]
MQLKPDYLGHRKRLRERFRKMGAEGFHDYEILELLLTYAIPRKDVKPIAKRLIKHFGSFSGVLDATGKELEEVASVGPISATLIRLVKETCQAYLSEKMKRREILSSPRAVLDFSRAKLSGLPHEAFMVIFVNAKNGVINHQILQEGTVNQAIIYPRRIVEEALSRHASGLILVHNHPSGEIHPSAEDRRLTRDLIEATRALDVRILDHLIVGKDGYFSFAESGFL